MTAPILNIFKFECLTQETKHTETAPDYSNKACTIMTLSALHEIKNSKNKCIDIVVKRAVHSQMSYYLTTGDTRKGEEVTYIFTSLFSCC